MPQVHISLKNAEYHGDKKNQEYDHSADQMHLQMGFCVFSLDYLVKSSGIFFLVLHSDYHY